MGHLVTDRSDGLRASVVVRRGDLHLTLSLDAPAGATTVVLGPNGAGKSTLLLAIAGLLPLAAGTVSLGGRVLEDPARDVAVPTARRRLGVVFQGGLLFDHLDVTENVAFGLRATGASRNEARAVAATWLDRLGAGDLAHRRPGELSGGQAQRVALARALATEPAGLLLDEPFSALDVSGRAQLRRVLTDVLAAFAGPRVLVTHDPAEAFLLGDVVHVIEDGGTTQVGTVDEIRLRPATPYVADLVGTNLLRGEADDGLVVTAGRVFRIADRELTGPVVLTIPPRAISLHHEPPTGSPRNVWPTTVDRVERSGDRVRVLLGAPAPLAVEITPAATDALGLRPGTAVHASLKATEIGVSPDA